MKKAIKIISLVLVALLLAGAIGAIWYFTDGGNEEFKTFMLSYNGEPIVNGKSTLALKAGEEHVFGTKYLFGTSTEKSKDYTVSVTPVPEVEFDYTVDGKQTTWRKAGDLTEFFVAQKAADGFRIEIEKDFSLIRLLSQLYSPSNVIVSSLPAADELLFRLTVTSYNQKVSYQIDFSVVGEGAGDVGQGGEDMAATHQITVDGTPGGTTWFTYAGPDSAHTGQRVEFFVSVRSGSPYETISEVKVSTVSGETVECEGWYSFIMPDEDVTISVTLTRSMHGG